VDITFNIAVWNSNFCDATPRSMPMIHLEAIKSAPAAFI